MKSKAEIGIEEAFLEGREGGGGYSPKTRPRKSSPSVSRVSSHDDVAAVSTLLAVFYLREQSNNHFSLFEASISPTSSLYNPDLDILYDEIFNETFAKFFYQCFLYFFIYIVIIVQMIIIAQRSI